jgi:hypothetical protein
MGILEFSDKRRDAGRLSCARGTIDPQKACCTFIDIADPSQHLGKNAVSCARKADTIRSISRLADPEGKFLSNKLDALPSSIFVLLIFEERVDFSYLFESRIL